MAPIKFEEQLKSKLEKRSLSPSADSWSKLSERLDADKKRIKTPVFWWLGIAASLVIMVAVTVSYFNANNTEQALPQLVNEHILKEQIKHKRLKEKEQKPVILANENTIIENKNTPKPVVNTPKTKGSTTINNKTQIAKNSSFKTRNLTQKISKNLKSKLETYQPTEHNAVTATLNELKIEATSVTNKEIDVLLKAANKEILKNKIQKSTKTVDANALLISVEDAMGESFRSKVFEALKANYKTIKTAVVERNN